MGAEGGGKKVYLLRLITHIVVQISAVMAGQQRDKTAAQTLRTSDQLLNQFGNRTLATFSLSFPWAKFPINSLKIK